MRALFAFARAAGLRVVVSWKGLAALVRACLDLTCKCASPLSGGLMAC
jgi:hypothetical protein